MSPFSPPLVLNPAIPATEQWGKATGLGTAQGHFQSVPPSVLSSNTLRQYYFLMQLCWRGEGWTLGIFQRPIRTTCLKPLLKQKAMFPDAAGL